MSLRSDLPRAFAGAWITISVIGMLAVVAPAVLPSDALYGLFPECEAKVRGGSCIACGMTTGFILLGNGDLAGARAANRGAPLVYFAFVVNFLVAVAYSITALVRRRHVGDQHTCNSSL